MASLSGVVYDPPANGFPFIAVLFGTEGEVLVARAVSNRPAGEAFIAKIFSEFAKTHGLQSRVDPL